jgi:hypothetical protein
VIDRKGGIEILQLSGGEPTLHPQFFELLAWAHAHPGIDYVLLNTNGVRIANDDAFADASGKTFRYGGIPALPAIRRRAGAGQRALAAATCARCKQARHRALRRDEHPGHARDDGDARQPPAPVGSHGVRPAVRPRARRELPADVRQRARARGEIRRFRRWRRFKELSSAKICAICGSFEQPITSHQSLNTADIILAAGRAIGCRLRFDDFTPLPCGDPNCATIGYLFKTPRACARSASSSTSRQVQGFPPRQNPLQPRRPRAMRLRVGAARRTVEKGRFELDERLCNTFRLFIKPFMDAWTWDEDRIDRCCTHVIRPDGKLDSFCRY